MIVYISALLFLLSLTLVVDTRWERFKKEERMNESNSPATPPAYYELPPSPPSYSQPPTVITYTLPAPYYQHQGRTVDRWGGPNIWGAVNTAPSWSLWSPTTTPSYRSYVSTARASSICSSSGSSSSSDGPRLQFWPKKFKKQKSSSTCSK